MKRGFAGLRRPPAAAYDAVVVGAGLGGLVSAALLARGGMRVLVVEQHYMVGGLCSTFRRAGFTFDAATHFYPLLGNSRTISGGLLAKLGVRTEWIKMDPVDHFHFPDGTDFTVPAERTLNPRLSKSSGSTFSLSASTRRAIASAIGERQVLPLQMNRIVVRSRRSMMRSS